MVETTATRNGNNRIVRVASNEELLTASKAIFDAVINALPSHIDKALEAKLGALELQVARLVEAAVAARFEALEKVMYERLQIAGDKVEEFVDRFTARQRGQETSTRQLHTAYRNAVTDLGEQLQTVIKSLPTPQVLVPEQPAPVVNIPNSALKVNAVLEVPERETTKTILYDSTTGRPAAIKEVSKSVLDEV